MRGDGPLALGDVAQDALHHPAALDDRRAHAHLDGNQSAVGAAHVDAGGTGMAGGETAGQVLPVLLRLDRRDERGRREPDERLERDAEQRAGTTVGVDDPAGGDIDDEDGVARGLEEAAIALLPVAHTAQHLPREQDSGEHHSERDAVDGELELPADGAHAVAERRGEGLLDRVQPAIQLGDAGEERREGGGVGRAALDAIVQDGCRVIELQEVAVGFAPDRDRAGHVRDRAEAPVEEDHLLDVVGMIAAGEEAGADHREIRAPPIELDARPVVPERDRHGRTVLLPVAWAARGGIAPQVEDGVLLALRPGALTLDVRAHAGHDGHLGMHEEQRAGDDRDEHHHDHDQAARDGCQRRAPFRAQWFEPHGGR